MKTPIPLLLTLTISPLPTSAAADSVYCAVGIPMCCQRTIAPAPEDVGRPENKKVVDTLNREWIRTTPGSLMANIGVDCEELENASVLCHGVKLCCSEPSVLGPYAVGCVPVVDQPPMTKSHNPPFTPLCDPTHK
ncbi:hypothetical protein EX30DRAFT_395407 [Ascodesmis nigricans]|uniref:Hydrophobin n=1 Tax=Ascodesmis nigricans TaxID=341454 RepID=A0A4S2MXY5_9PEZI|nr:hypothetical protein EX30DRAFT_395407 [Ascodesmis nigricans]